MTFSSFLPRTESAHRSPALEPLAHLQYAQELEYKNTAVWEFWKHHRLRPVLASLVPSPMPRGYRTTTKRRIPIAKQTVSLLEPPEHGRLYTFIAEKLSTPGYRALAGALNFVIVRGSYTERTVIFNVCRLDGPIVKKLKNLSQHLPVFDAAVVSAFVFVDPTRSDYYLDIGEVPDGLKSKKLFGPEKIFVKFNESRYQFGPTLFSQVNHAMVPVMLEKVKGLLSPSPSGHLIDLYCGYGLFTHFLAPGFAHACGLEAVGPAVEAARENAKFHKGSGKTLFRTGRISGVTFANLLPRSDGHPEYLFTDPPRQGMDPVSITALCQRAPVRVVEACCGIDEVPGQVAAWEKGGYRLASAVPLDMFAGTAHLETLLLFEPHG
ncbi:MAG: class I SAM-dependent RNA methyltransferase [Fibrobacterota bacterium]